MSKLDPKDIVIDWEDGTCVVQKGTSLITIKYKTDKK